MYKAWLPFDYTISALFYLAYLHQILSFIFIGLVHPGTDNFICGLLLHACCQLEILEYRITNIANGRESLRNCVRHHLCIFEYAYTLNERFSRIIPGEFIMIMVVTCYELIHMATTSSSNITYLQDMMAVACTLAAIFYYCWFGNEIKHKSLQLSDNIWCNMEWTILSDNVKKGLIMIMNRAMIPIEFSSSHLMPMNLDSFVMITVLCIIVNAVFMDLRKGNLTYRAWFPFDYTPPTIFYLVFTHQMVGMSITAVMNVACDSLIFGLLQQICYQIEILEYRLTKISLGQHIFRDCVRHHNHIYEYACTVNHRFAPLIALQFAVSMLVVCANLYKIAAMKINAGSVVLILYTACMLSQIFIYCWFGNELKLKSIDLANNIYNMDWYTLDTNSKKGLLFIMKRAMVPIEFNSAIIITLNLNSFVSLLKSSYSAYNVLKTAQ
nr:PREDICTED: odorant receptor Or1-like [Linepithema humile]